MKNGVFFTIDSIIAAGIIFAVVISTSSLYVEDQPTVNINYMSKDLIDTLSIITIREVDNEYINSLSPLDVNEDNTILEQIVEFWADNDLEKANKTMANMTDLFVPDNMGFGLWIDGEAIYTKDLPLEKSLVSSKMVVSGIEKGKTTGLTRKNPPTLLGPVVVEVRVWQ